MRFAYFANVDGLPTNVGWYELNPFPGNNQVVVSNNAFILPKYRGKGYGKASHEERLRKAKELGYKYIICTVSKENGVELNILEKFDWIALANFWSEQKNHLVGIYGKNLE